MDNFSHIKSIIPNRKVYVVGGSTGYANWMQAKLVDNMEDATFVCFTGGEDISPFLYGAKQHPTTYNNVYRDKQEVTAFKKALALNKPIIGICRGAQLGAVLSGGRLVQNQENRRFWHPIQTYNNKTVWTTSTHHQAALVCGMPKENYKILGWTIKESSFHMGETDNEELVIDKVPENKEMEEVYYPKTRFLGLQHHPEMIYDEYLKKDQKSTEYIMHSRYLLDCLLNESF